MFIIMRTSYYLFILCFTGVVLCRRIPRSEKQDGTEITSTDHQATKNPTSLSSCYSPIDIITARVTGVATVNITDEMRDINVEVKRELSERGNVMVLKLLPAGTVMTANVNSDPPAVDDITCEENVSHCYMYSEIRWGPTDESGSDHSLGGMLSPLEMQHFFRNSDGKVKLAVSVRYCLKSEEAKKTKNETTEKASRSERSNNVGVDSEAKESSQENNDEPRKYSHNVALFQDAAAGAFIPEVLLQSSLETITDPWFLEDEANEESGIQATTIDRGLSNTTVSVRGAFILAPPPYFGLPTTLPEPTTTSTTLPPSTTTPAPSITTSTSTTSTSTTDTVASATTASTSDDTNHSTITASTSVTTITTSTATTSVTTSNDIITNPTATVTTSTVTASTTTTPITVSTDTATTTSDITVTTTTTPVTVSTATTTITPITVSTATTTSPITDSTATTTSPITVSTATSPISLSTAATTTTPITVSTAATTTTTPVTVSVTTTTPVTVSTATTTTTPIDTATPSIIPTTSKTKDTTTVSNEATDNPILYGAPASAFDVLPAKLVQTISNPMEALAKLVSGEVSKIRIKISDFLPTGEVYYQYRGNLPGKCDEVFDWLVFEEELEVNPSLLTKLRTLNDAQNSHKLVTNFQQSSEYPEDLLRWPAPSNLKGNDTDSSLGSLMRINPVWFLLPLIIIIIFYFFV